VVEPGAAYSPGAVTIMNRVDIGGQAGAAIPQINGTLILNNAGAKAHDLGINAAGGNVAFAIDEGQADRIAAIGGATRACHLMSGTLRDSVCDGASVGGSAGIEVDSLGPGGHAVELRNVTAVALSGYAIRLYSSGSQADTINGVNVIASGALADIHADQGIGGVSNVTLANSNYSTVTRVNGAGVTAEGTNGNQTSPPLFVSKTGADLHELAGSPTIDAGVAAADLGPLDLDRNPRSTPPCLGGTGVPDIGAYERPTVSPPLATCSIFTIGQLKLNKKKGTADLFLTVPGSGSLKASGKGLKGANANPTAAGEIKLKLKASGKSKRKLADKGKLKLTVKLAWTPTGGTATTQTDKIKLKNN
jgi:hypothetical protein